MVGNKRILVIVFLLLLLTKCAGGKGSYIVDYFFSCNENFLSWNFLKKKSGFFLIPDETWDILERRKLILDQKRHGESNKSLDFGMRCV